MEINYRKLVFFLGIVFSLHFAIAQPPCGTNAIAADFCADAVPICNLNGYCGNTSATYTNYVSSTNHTNETNTPLGAIFCASIQNNSWIKFIADSTVAVFSIWTSNCSDNHGIQMQIYSTTDCYNFVAVSNCWNPMSPTSGQITAVGLVPGQTYYFMIDGTNGDNCDYVIAANTGVNVSPAVSTDQTICHGDTTTLSAVGGVTYAWTSSPVDSSLLGQSTSSSISVSPEVTTTYTVTVNVLGDNSFCDDSTSVLTSIVYVNPLPVVSILSTNEHCNLSDGIATALVEGDSTSYNYSWNTVPLQYSRTVTGLVANTYIVTVTDSNGCSSSDSTVISNLPYLTPEISGLLYLCDGSNTVLTVESNYSSYLWSDNSISDSITVNSAGIYWVSVTDVYGCSGTDSVVVSSVSSPDPSILGQSFVCPSGSVQLDAGENFTSYLWSTGDTERIISATDGGIYYVSVTDIYGCEGDTNFYLFYNDGPIVVINTENENCEKGNGMAFAEVSGGSNQYLYLWSTGATTPGISGLSQGNYTVTVSDSLCIVNQDFVIENIPGPTASFYFLPEILTYFDQPVSATFYSTSTGSIVDWQWDFGDGSFSISGGSEIEHFFNSVGNYSVSLIVTDENNCIDTVINIVTVRDIFTFYIPNSFSPDGDGINDLFTPYGNNVDPENFEMLIFDRWGALFFETRKWQNDCSDGWNGTKMNQGTCNDVIPGVYVYKISIREIFGKKHIYTGHVVVVK